MRYAAKVLYIALLVAFAVLMASCSPKFSHYGGIQPLSQLDAEPPAFGEAIPEAVDEEETVVLVNAESQEKEAADPVLVSEQAFNEPDLEDHWAETKPGTQEKPDSGDTGWMRSECEDYYEKLISGNIGSSQKKLDILRAAESTIDPGSTVDTWNEPLKIETWQSVLRDAFGIDNDAGSLQHYMLCISFSRMNSFSQRPLFFQVLPRLS